ncbi:MAG TPA: hypothetical protein LFW20_01120 [Rickettsia endosymbiont of Omalisus fontisbellaquei]|nr:hypothetical protein [Rickettsia endosymbiont of Omalisus fontisbellaquei]
MSIPADPTVGIGRSKEKLKDKQGAKKVSDYKYGVRNSMELYYSVILLI